MKKLKNKLILLFLFSAITAKLDAQQNLFSTFNSNSFSKGDSIHFEVGINSSNNKIKTASLHLWIEEIASGRKWHYKYPMIDGKLSARLVIDSGLLPGIYAFNFFLQRNFFRIKGEIKNAYKKDKQINYVLLSKNKDIVSGVLTLGTNNTFFSECMLFQDSAYIVFSRADHKAGNLEINLVNELDSSFIAMDSLTHFITIIDRNDSIQKKNTIPVNYKFNSQDRLYKTIMPEVIVKSKTKKIIDDFQKENVSVIFGGADGTIIVGLESDEISRAADLFNFLIGKVAGLSIKKNDEGDNILMWRKHHTDIYIDEIKVDADLASQISLSDIAMIKIFEPGVQVSFGSGAGGTIAIYLKTGVYKRENKPTNNFRIMGYNGLDVIWK